MRFALGHESELRVNSIKLNLEASSLELLKKTIAQQILPDGTTSEAGESYFAGDDYSVNLQIGVAVVPGDYVDVEVQNISAVDALTFNMFMDFDRE